MKTSFFDILRSNIVSFLKVSMQYASKLASNLQVSIHVYRYRIYHLLIRLFCNKNKDSYHDDLKIYDPYGSIEYVIASKLANVEKQGSRKNSMLSMHDSLIKLAESYSLEDFLHDINLVAGTPDIPSGYEIIEVK